ncbi:protein NO VEIN domain-containing protein [Spirosoma soli]|uniref:Protein NO VEIN domain-containing protein n=1 Tax=Spirosoma soli TaxID=1770529 RepID=A0ABW5MDS0_9BACT
MTHSDLTFFKRYFEDKNKNGVNPSNQKAINLTAKIFINKLYPYLSRDKRYYLGLKIQGPGLATEPQILARKIIFKAKNWRLNGEFIHDPEKAHSIPDRYENINPGDLAVLEFFDNPSGEPDRINIILISQVLPTDRNIYQTLKGFVSERDSMALLPEEILIDVIDILPEDHSLQSLVADNDALELLAEGVDIGIGAAFIDSYSNEEPASSKKTVNVRKYRTSDFNKSAKPSQRRVSAEAFQTAKVNQEQNGKIGEELVEAYFSNNPSIGSFEWSSKENAISPYDFKRVDQEEGELIDVKATSRRFEEPFHLSINEVRQAACAPSTYHIYRVYDVQGQPKMRISADIKSFAQGILTQVQSFQTGIIPDGFTLSAILLERELNFGPPISLSPSDDEDVDAS